jgi:hypothetical protein
MAIGTDVATAKPAVIGAIRIGTKVCLGVDGAPAASGEGDHRWRGLRCRGASSSPLFTGLAQRFVAQTGERLGCFGALASGGVRGAGGVGRVPGIVRGPEMEEEADEDKSSQKQLVKQEV